MVEKIRVGVLGASAAYGWGGRAHAPAIEALPEYELVAVGTSRPETAALAAEQLGARHAHHDYRELIANPEVDLVCVSVKAPLHYDMTMAALRASKPVFTEWPLAANVGQAEEMTALAVEKGIPNIVGLQARVSPGVMHLKELIDEGYVGTPLSCSMTMFLTSRERDSVNAWEGDRKQGGNVLSIHSGHSIDALCFCLGDFAELSSYVLTQVPTWHVSDTGEDVSVDAPDNILVNGMLQSGCIASVHVAAAPGPAPGWRMQVYGTEGSLLATSTLMLQYGEVVLRGARRQEVGDSYRYVGEAAFQEIPIPGRHTFVPDSVPGGPPSNIAQLYRRLSDGMLHGKPVHPDFEHALKHHRLLNAIEVAAETGTVQKLG